MAYAKVKASATIGTQSVSTVVIGPIKIDGGSADIVMQTKTGGSGATTPTAYKLQISIDEAGSVFGDVASATITAGTGANAVVQSAVFSVVGLWIQVVSGAAFAAGTANLVLFGVEK
jgi:hypothetical protein